jgi:hypothetical protein
MPKSSLGYSQALPAVTSTLELDARMLELLLIPTELEEGTPLLELSVEGEDGDSEQAKTAREIAVASAGIVIFLITFSPRLILYATD